MFDEAINLDESDAKTVALEGATRLFLNFDPSYDPDDLILFDEVYVMAAGARMSDGQEVVYRYIAAEPGSLVQHAAQGMETWLEALADESEEEG